MRAKNEFKFIAEAYQNVHKEGTEDEVEFPNSEYGRSLERAAKQQAQEDKEDKEVPERTKLLIQLVADGYVRLHKDGEFQVLAPWDGSNFPILKGQGWEEVPFPSIRLTRPGESTVQLRPPYTDIQTYLKDGYEVVEDYTKATQSEDGEDRDHPDYGEPEYNEERSERFRDDGPEDRKAPEPTKSIENQDETKRRMKQLGWEDNETRAQKAERRREEKQRYDLHGNVLKHVKGPHDIYKK
tara:strand:+ start:137 stop:856 length:720 start_codon:yes stop_codon:yes gene_type:complete